MKTVLRVALVLALDLTLLGLIAALLWFEGVWPSYPRPEEWT